MLADEFRVTSLAGSFLFFVEGTRLSHVQIVKLLTCRAADGLPQPRVVRVIHFQFRQLPYELAPAAVSVRPLLHSVRWQVPYYHV